MKKTLFVLLLAAMLTATACSSTSGQSSAPPVSEVEISAPDLEAEQPQVNPPVTDENPASDDPLEGLERDEYEGLEITAAVLPRMAILPGSSVPVTVTVTNTGDKTISYVQGSGAFETPDALVVRADGLQPVRPRDHLGAVTMDYVTKDLEPGDSLEFEVYVMAIQPHEEFDNYTHDFFTEQEHYIGESDWETIRTAFPELEPVQPGSYTATVSFRYTVPGDEANDLAGLFGPTGYAQTEFQIGVSD